MAKKTSIFGMNAKHECRSYPGFYGSISILQAIHNLIMRWASDSCVLIGSLKHTSFDSYPFTTLLFDLFETNYAVNKPESHDVWSDVG